MRGPQLDIRAPVGAISIENLGSCGSDLQIAISSNPCCVPMRVVSDTIHQTRSDWVLNDVTGQGTKIFVGSNGAIMISILPKPPAPLEYPVHIPR